MFAKKLWHMQYMVLVLSGVFSPGCDGVKWSLVVLTHAIFCRSVVSC